MFLKTVLHKIAGAKMILHVRNLAIWPGADEGPGLRRVGGERAFFKAEIAQQVGQALRPGQADRLGAFHGKSGAGMVLQVLADARQVAGYGDAEIAQVRGRANTGEHEKLRRSNGPGAKDDLALGALLHAAALVLEADGGRAAAFKTDAIDLRIGAQGQVGARGRGMQKCRRRAVPLTPGLRHLVKPEPLLAGGVEIRIALEAGFFPGVYKSLRQRVHGAQVAYMQRPGDAVILGRAALLVL